MMWTSIRHTASALAVTALCATPIIAQQKTTEQPRPAGAKVVAPTAQTPQPGTRPAAPATQQNQARQAPARQQANPAIQRTANKPVVSNQSPAETDQMIAGMLALGNQEESMLGKFAAEHAKHEQVQKFADMMVKEHADMAKKLQKWAPDATLDSADSDAATNNDTSKNAQLPFDANQVHRQIAARCLASSKKCLSEKKGNEFDQAYIGSQIGMHQQMIDKATVLRQYVSPELRSTIDKGIESAENHLDHAKSLMEKLASAESSGK